MTAALEFGDPVGGGEQQRGELPRVLPRQRPVCIAACGGGDEHRQAVAGRRSQLGVVAALELRAEQQPVAARSLARANAMKASSTRSTAASGVWASSTVCSSSISQRPQVLGADRGQQALLRVEVPVGRGARNARPMSHLTEVTASSPPSSSRSAATRTSVSRVCPRGGFAMSPEADNEHSIATVLTPSTCCCILHVDNVNAEVSCSRATSCRRDRSILGHRPGHGPRAGGAWFPRPGRCAPRVRRRSNSPVSASSRSCSTSPSPPTSRPIAERVESDRGSRPLGALVNNAGVAVNGPVEAIPIAGVAPPIRGQLLRTRRSSPKRCCPR